MIVTNHVQPYLLQRILLDHNERRSYQNDTFSIIRPADNILAGSLQDVAFPVDALVRRTSHNHVASPNRYPFALTIQFCLHPLLSSPILSSASSMTTELPLMTTIPSLCFSPFAFSSMASSSTILRNNYRSSACP